jgi:hypothetical protein
MFVPNWNPSIYKLTSSTGREVCFIINGIVQCIKTSVSSSNKTQGLLMIMIKLLMLFRVAIGACSENHGNPYILWSISELFDVLKDGAYTYRYPLKC